MKALLFDLRFFITLGLISLVLFLVDSLGLLKLPKTAVQYITIPVQYGLYQTGISFQRHLEFITLARTAALENKALKTQLANLLTENSSLRKQLLDNQSLTDQYSKLNPQTYDLLPTRIIGMGKSITIDKGENDGIVIGQVVVFKDNYFGQIKGISPKSAEVLLPQDPTSKLAVFSQGEGGRAKGILVGQFGSEFLMDKILHQEKVSVGDLVYSEGTEGKLPKGLIIGRITQVFDRQNEVFQQAKVEPVFNLTDLDIVFVIKNP